MKDMLDKLLGKTAKKEAKKLSAEEERRAVLAKEKEEALRAAWKQVASRAFGAQRAWRAYLAGAGFYPPLHALNALYVNDVFDGLVRKVKLG